MQQPWYATREQIKSALDIAETARSSAQIDRAIATASRSIESMMGRKFYPYDGTRYVGYPQRNSNTSWRVWLDAHEVVSLSSLASGGVTISASDYFLEPVNSGPPYTSIEIDLSSNAVFTAGDTWQRSIVATGTFGYWDEQEEAGELADNLDADITDTATITWTDADGIGVGSILKIDSERMIVSETSFVDTTQNLGTALTASAANTTVDITDGTGFYAGETIRIDSERMLVVDTAAGDITVKRAWDGSVLAAHSQNADVYGKTGVQLSRAALGSTLAAHTTSDVVYRYVVPELINSLCVAETAVQLQNEGLSYPRSTSDRVSEPAGAGLRALREQVQQAYARRARFRSI